MTNSNENADELRMLIKALEELFGEIPEGEEEE